MRKLDASELRQERELLTRINEMLRLIEEEGETIEITDKGKVVAHLVPTITPEKATEKKRYCCLGRFEAISCRA